MRDIGAPWRGRRLKAKYRIASIGALANRKESWTRPDNARMNAGRPMTEVGCTASLVKLSP